MAPTLILSIFYLIFVPSKTLRIKYHDESNCSVIHRTLSFILKDMARILRVRSLRWLVIANMIGATTSMMMLFIFGLWLQSMFHLNVVGVALFTVVLSSAELSVLIMNLSHCVHRNRMGIAAGMISIIFVALCYGSTYLTVNVCDHRNGSMEMQWLCEWISMGHFDMFSENDSLSINMVFAVLCLFGIFIGHEAFVSTLNSSIFRECRRSNTPNAAYPLWNIIDTVGNVVGPLTVGMLWVFCGQTHSMLTILPLICILDVVALCAFICSTRSHKQK